MCADKNDDGLQTMKPTARPGLPVLGALALAAAEVFQSWARS